MIHPIRGHVPQFSPSSRMAGSAAAVGEVTLGQDVSLWHGAVIRADNAPVTVGEGSNIQDNAVIHESPGYPVSIGRFVTVGHGAIVHGCTVEDRCIIGMGAILLNGCVIGHDCLVAAGALVPQNRVIPPQSLVMGSPARVIRSLTPEEIGHNMDSALEYIARAEQELPMAGKEEQT